MSAETTSTTLLVDIASGLEDGSLSAPEAAARLRAAAAQDLATLDETEIEVDFDAEGPGLLGALPFLSGPKPAPMPDDPVDAALLAAVGLRDRSSALRIVGDVPGEPDTEAYQRALEALRDALNTHLPKGH